MIFLVLKNLLIFVADDIFEDYNLLVQNKPVTRKKKRITIKLYELKDEIITCLVGASKFNHELSGN